MKETVMVDKESNWKDALKWEAEKFYTANKLKNAASTNERKAQKELDVLMAEAGDGDSISFEHTFDYSGKRITVEVSYEQGVRDAVDVTKLHSKVDIYDFLGLVTASKAAVEKMFGKNIANLCTVSKLSEFKTKVKEKK